MLSKQEVIAELWRRGELSWKLHAGQKKIYAAIKALPPEVREILLLVSRRWGKSYLGLTMALEDGLRGRGRQVIICGPNLKQTKKIITPLLKLLKEGSPKGLIKETKSELTWQVGASQLLITAFDTAPESIRGIFADNIYLEESGLADPDEYEYVIDSVLRPTLMHSRGKIIHLTTPARFPAHPLHMITMPKCKLTNSFYKYSIYDNPLLSEEQIDEEIANSGGLNSSSVQRELLCNIQRDETIVCVPEFREDLYVKDLGLPLHYNFWVAADMGGVRDKSVLLFMTYLFDAGKIYVFDELAFDNTTPTAMIVPLAVELEAIYKPPMFRAVDASGQTLTDLCLTHKYDARLPAKESLDASVNLIRTHFSRDSLVISPKCPQLIATLESQRFNKQRSDLERTNSLGHGDALMALVYGLREACLSNPYPTHFGASWEQNYIYQDDEKNRASDATKKALIDLITY